MNSGSWAARRGEIETYFDRTAAEAWARLTSDAPVSAIRATVRAGREAMRATLLGWLPQDMRGLRLLDAGYRVAAVQPVDMFPHTQHVENVVLLSHRNVT